MTAALGVIDLFLIGSRPRDLELNRV